MSFDAIIVGGGIVGCTTAFFLSLKGQKVAIVEKEQLASGTSASNFSWINATSKTSNAAYHRLNARGVSMYDDLAAEFGADALGLKSIGSLGYVSCSDETAFAALEEQEHALAAFGYPNRRINLEELREAEPHMVFPDDMVALLAPADKCLDASRFVRLMADQVCQHGGQVFESTTALELIADDEDAVTGLATSKGEMTAPAVILTSGPNTPEVLGNLTGFDGFATRFPVRKVPGLLVTTPPVPDGLVRHLVYTDTGGEFHVFPDFNGGLRIASDDTDGEIIGDQSPENLRELAKGLLRRMQKLAPEFAGETLIDECKLSIGIRAYPEDGLSIAGPLPGATGLFVIATHSGITLAPVLGCLMADLIVDGEVPEMLEPFGLDRLQGFA